MTTIPDPPSPQPGRGGAGRLLRATARRHWPRLALTYFLFTVENALLLLQPLCLGLAIDGLLRGSLGGWWLLTGAYFGHLLLGAARRLYDSRTFTTIYRELATDMVTTQRGRGVSVSQVATRSTLSRSLVEFLEFDLPQLMHTAYALVGALVLLCWYSPTVAAACVALAGPCWLLTRWYRRRLAYHNRVLHDEMEREVDVIGANRRAEVEEHYHRLSRTWVRLSDWEAFNTAVAQLLLIVLVTGVLLHLCLDSGATPGDVFAVLRYLLLFVTGVDGLPIFVRQFTRFQDIAARVDADPEPGTSPLAEVAAQQAPAGGPDEPARQVLAP